MEMPNDVQQQFIFAAEAISLAAERAWREIAQSHDYLAMKLQDAQTRPCVLFGAGPHWNPDRQCWEARVREWGSDSVMADTSPIGLGKTPAEAMASFDKVYKEGYATGGVVKDPPGA